MSSWKRPGSVPYPKAWRRAVGRKPVDGKVPSFVIQDVPEDRMEELVEFMIQNFGKNEPLNACLDVSEDAVVMREFRDMWEKMLPQRISLVAFLEDDGPRPRIVGANIIGVVTRAEKNAKHEFEGEATKKIMKFLDDLDSLADPFEKYGMEEYITAIGLSVVKEFQGQGLGKELLKARFDVGRAMGLKLTVTAFTAKESQVLATREGFEELARITHADYKVDGKEVFPGVRCECSILMAKKIE